MISGVYAIKNLVNGKCYVGQSKNITWRLLGHKVALTKGIHYNKHLQSAVNKHGIDNFSFEVLEICELDKKVLCVKEQKWMDKLDSAYNMAPVAGSTLGLKLSKKVCERMSRMMKGRKITWGKKISKAKKGVLHITQAQIKADKEQSIKRKGKVPGPTKGMKIPNISKAMKKIWKERHSLEAYERKSK
jgi:group I intron endonuclease